MSLATSGWTSTNVLLTGGMLHVFFLAATLEEPAAAAAAASGSGFTP